MTAMPTPSDDPITLTAMATWPCFVAWQTEDRGDGKPPTKVPYAPDGRKARANQRSTWGTRAAAEEMAAKLPKPYGVGGVGLEFAPLDDGRALAGIDLDTCRDPGTGQFEQWALDIIERFGSYAETSPSGTGAKIFFTYTHADLPSLRAAMNGAAFGKQFKRGGGEHPPAIELHLGNRYFAITDEHLPGSPIELNHVATELLLQLIQHDGPVFAGGADLADDEEAVASQAAPRRTIRSTTGGTDRSRSAGAFRKGAAVRRDGGTFEEMVQALRDDPETADWTREKGEANGQRELRRIWDRAAPKPEDHRPLIRIAAGKLAELATQAEAVLKASGLPVFQRGAMLVQPISAEVPASRGRMTVSAALSELTQPAWLDLLSQVARWEKYDGRSEDWIAADPSGIIAAVHLSRAGSWTLPRIAGVVTTPTLRPDGSLLTGAGYDPATRLYHVQDPTLRLRDIPDRPTRSDAETALGRLKWLLTGFPFVSEVDRAVALSLLITPVVRGALSVAPLHAVKANTAGTGKSYLVDLASAITTGRPCPVVAAAANADETEKRLVGLLLAAFPIVSLDNVNGELGGDILCQAVERPLIRVRPLGRSDIMEIESRACIFATGNALRVKGDMVRRSLVCSLDAGMERPELRSFQSDPVAEAIADRGLYVSACLTIVRAYITAGYPDVLPPLASFEDWSGVVRSALVWLGCPDPCVSMEAAREDDPELTEMREILTLWQQTFGQEGKTVRDVAEEASSRKPTQMGEPTDFAAPELRDALLRVAGDRGNISTRRLGKWLMDHEARIVGGLRIKRDGMAHGGIARWAVRS